MTDPAAPTARRGLRVRRSVRVRITLAAVAVTAAAVGLASWLLVRSVEDTQLGQVRGDLEAQLDPVVTALEAGDDPDDAVEEAPSWSTVQVTDADGDVVAAGPAATVGSQPVVVDIDPSDVPLPEGTAPPDGRAPARVSAITGDSGGALESMSRTVTTPTGTYTLYATAEVEQVARSLDALRRALAVGLPAVVLLVAAIAWALVGRALRPVEAIRAEVDEITGSTMHRRVPEPPTGDEIGRLARTMNAMLHRLEATSTRQRQFVSDASHELRSPVAAIRTRLEVARRNPDRADWPAVADAALAEEARLEALLDDLLLLASHDETGTTALAGAPVDLGAVAISDAERARRVPVEVAPHPGRPGDLLVVGVADQLARAVGNLLDNAARHAHSAVRVQLEHDQGTVRLAVDDDGPGIPAADRERVFERFTRLDDSRVRHRGGSGLGLAVVRSIVTNHHGRARATASPLGGARFVIELPAAGHPSPSRPPEPGSPLAPAPRQQATSEP